MKPSDLIQRFPLLFHMAEDGSWPSIKNHGLLSTSHLLDLYEVGGNYRRIVESCHRPDSITIHRQGMPNAVVRDQKPMSDAGLIRCLDDGLTPREWYRTLNSMCFFWLTEERLQRLLNARPYRLQTHTVLVLDTKSVIAKHHQLIRLSPMNSGCTKPFPHPRGKNTFLPIKRYPFDDWDKKRRGKDPIVELAILGGLPDVDQHVAQVRRMRGARIQEVIWRR